MTTKVITIAAILLFGWAIVRTGEGERKKPESKATLRQVRVVETTAQYRLVKHSMGETKVPLAPKRIASLCSAATDGLVALGIRPILVQSGAGLDGPQLYLADRLNGVPALPRGATVSLEAVLNAKPDLIFASGMQNGRMYGQLSKIAPTVLVGSTTGGLRENRLLDVGETLGMHKQARQLLADYRQRLTAAKTRIGSRAQTEPVAFLRFRKNTCVIYTQADMFGPLLFQQLGLTPDPAMPMVMTGGGWDVLSIERLSALQADHLFITVDPDSELYVQSVARTPIWRNIPAVRHDHVHRVVSSTWLSDGLLGSEAIVDDVVAAMTPERSP
jgi:iron complex transport system substrate-binding protein